MRTATVKVEIELTAEEAYDLHRFAAPVAESLCDPTGERGAMLPRNDITRNRVGHKIARVARLAEQQHRELRKSK